jgi:hypothetical protein
MLANPYEKESKLLTPPTKIPKSKRNCNSCNGEKIAEVDV